MDFSNQLRSILVVAVRKLEPHLHDVKEGYLEKQIPSVLEAHALGAAAASATSMIPGVGPAISVVTATAATWSMFFRINACLGVKLSKNILKTLASAIVFLVTNAAVYGVSIVLAGILSVIPGIGSAAAFLIEACLNFAAVWLAGYIYLLMMADVLGAGKDPEKMTAEELEKIAKRTTNAQRIKELFKDLSLMYLKAKRKGEVTGKETMEFESEDESF